MNILLLGSGGREHAIAFKIAQSAQCTHLYIAPGNAGTAQCGINVDMDVNDFEAIGSFVLQNNVEMVVVGPEVPLVGGIVDFLRLRKGLGNVAIIGPDREGARLEGSKDYAKAFMQEFGIPTARHRTFTADTLDEGLQFLATLKAPYVLKADGLAAGKGVLILDSLSEAQEELRSMLLDAKFGGASAKVVIEEYLNGIELSSFVLLDGKHYLMLPSAKDYKRIGEGDTGLNTGGMGSISPVPFADSLFMEKVESRIVAPTLKGLRQRGIDYRGFLFVGLMAVPNEHDGTYDPYVIEYNVRMGDPETESVFPRLKSDVVTMLDKAAKGTLNTFQLSVDNRFAACVMMVAGGYPGSYGKGAVIRGAEEDHGALVFHAGTRRDDTHQLVTAGGRVICTTALASSLPEAILASYQAADHITWEGRYCRRDIGQDLLRLMV